MSATESRDEDVFEVTMKAVVIYDDFELVVNATALLELVSPPPEDAAEQAVKWKVKTYVLDKLNKATVAEAVLIEAAEADLVVFAMNKTEFLPAWMVFWLESWAVRKRVEDPAFVVLGGDCDTGSSPSAASELRRFARRHGLSCTCDEGPSVDGEPANIIRNGSEEALFHEPFSRVTMPSAQFRGWGINE
jgi:hypothetical protein